MIIVLSASFMVMSFLLIAAGALLAHVDKGDVKASIAMFICMAFGICGALTSYTILVATADSMTLIHDRAYDACEVCIEEAEKTTVSSETGKAP